MTYDLLNLKSFGLETMARLAVRAGALALAVIASVPVAWGAPLKVGVVAFPASAGDPHRSVSVFATYLWSPIFETLTVFREDGTLEPQLATSWEQIRPATWRFNLRDGVKFSNGKSFTAAAVAASLAYLKTPEGQTASVARGLGDITAVRVINDLTLEIDTNHPNVVIPRELSALFIVEPEHWETLGSAGFAQNPVGSGPFMVQDWAPGRVIYEPNPLSWRQPEVDSLEILLLPEATSRLQALVTGRIDIAIGMGPDDQPVIERAGGYLHQRNSIDVITITFVIGEGKPADDVRVRRALNYAVDKNAITEILLSGYSKPATQAAVRGLLGYNPDLETYPYDPARARALLAEAGYEDGFTLRTEAIIGSNASDSAIYQLVAANLKEVGVTLELIPVPTQQMARVILQGEWRGDAFTQIFGGWPTFEPLRSLRLASCLWPNPWYCDPAIMPAFEAALHAPDLEQRTALTRDVLSFYHDQATALMLHEIPILDGVGPQVRNYAPDKGRVNYTTIKLLD